MPHTVSCILGLAGRGGISASSRASAWSGHGKTTTWPLCLAVCTAHTGHAHPAPCPYTWRQECRSPVTSARTHTVVLVLLVVVGGAQNTIHEAPLSQREVFHGERRAAPRCLTDKVRGSSPLIQRHFGGAFQDDFLGWGCAHCGRLLSAQTCKEMRQNSTDFNALKKSWKTNI